MSLCTTGVSFNKGSGASTGPQMDVWMEPAKLYVLCSDLPFEPLSKVEIMRRSQSKMSESGRKVPLAVFPVRSVVEQLDVSAMGRGPVWCLRVGMPLFYCLFPDPLLILIAHYHFFLSCKCQGIFLFPKPTP